MQHAHSPHTAPVSCGKNRIHSTLAKYALSPEDGTDLFSKKGQAWLEQAIPKLPPETGRCLQQEVELLGSLNDQIQTLEARIGRKSLSPRAYSF